MKEPQDSTHKYSLELTAIELRIINASLALGDAVLEASAVKWSKEKINVLKKLRKEFDKYETYSKI